jgi:hypothetical protein
LSIFQGLGILALSCFLAPARLIINLSKGGGMAELIARPPTQPKVRGLNHFASKKFFAGNFLEHGKDLH